MLCLNDGSGGFGTGAPIGKVTHNTRSIALGDVDADGDLDVIEGNSESSNMSYLNDGLGIFDLGSAVEADADYTCSIRFGDLDGDRDLDVVAGNVGQTNKVYLNVWGGM